MFNVICLSQLQEWYYAASRRRIILEPVFSQNTNESLEGWERRVIVYPIEHSKCTFVVYWVVSNLLWFDYFSQVPRILRLVSLLTTDKSRFFSSRKLNQFWNNIIYHFFMRLFISFYFFLQGQCITVSISYSFFTLNHNYKFCLQSFKCSKFKSAIHYFIFNIIMLYFKIRCSYLFCMINFSILNRTWWCSDN